MDLVVFNKHGACSLLIKHRACGLLLNHRAIRSAAERQLLTKELLLEHKVTCLNALSLAGESGWVTQVKSSE